MYNLNGLLIRTATSEDVLKQLPDGVYIVNGKVGCEVIRNQQVLLNVENLLNVCK